MMKEASEVSPYVLKPEDLPSPTVEMRSRDFRRRSCPRCQKGCYRDSRGKRSLYDLGSSRTARPHRLDVVYSKHSCEPCGIYFNADMADLAPVGVSYTQRVISTALRLVLEDNLPYRAASWHLWRDHRVFVPFAT